ncbi:hypothetical protein FOPE_05638 [Fonsecaea pedrosoi]|nr:hypothetical protein FOPE_05638 [Fonsecaea pedrosoi]
MDAENQQQKSQAPQTQSEPESAISQQPAARESMDASGVSNRVGLRGGGEGEDICCGLYVLAALPSLSDNSKTWTIGH